MVTTLTRPPTASPPANGERLSDVASSRAGRRNGTRIALGLVVVVLCVLGTVSLYTSAGRRAAVLSVRQAIPAGREISAEDLGTVSVSVGSGLRTIPASDRAQIVGRIAAVDLVAGTLLTSGELSNGPLVPAGRAISGATLKPGQYPVGLIPGDEVVIVETPPPSTTGTAAVPKDHGRGRVLDLVTATDGTGSVTISLVVPDDVATAVATAGAAGRLSLVMVGRR